MSPKKVDFIIVGQGLAGSILSYLLIAKGKTVLVIDNEQKHSSSFVAAGIINPITGPRLALNDNFSVHYATAKKLYETLETDLKASIWLELSQQRLLKNDTQFGYYEKRLKDPNYSDYLGNLLYPNAFNLQKKVIQIKQTALVDSKALLKHIHVWLNKQQSIRSEKLHYQQLQLNEIGVRYGDIQASKIIFCEGHQAIHNPWLRKLPFLLSKGEILTLDINETNNDLLNWGHWLVPTNRHHKLGSNYHWDNLDLLPSQETKNALLNDLNNNLKWSTNVIKNVTNHEVGIRPTTKHRQPFIGPLKNTSNAYCFNGFGSKGCLLIPHYATVLTDHLCMNTNLPEHVTNGLDQCL